MGRSKKELRKIHNRKIRKAKQKLQLFKTGQISLQQLTQRARHFLTKGKKKRTILA